MCLVFNFTQLSAACQDNRQDTVSFLAFSKAVDAVEAKYFITYFRKEFCPFLHLQKSLDNSWFADLTSFQKTKGLC